MTSKRNKPSVLVLVFALLLCAYSFNNQHLLKNKLLLSYIQPEQATLPLTPRILHQVLPPDTSKYDHWLQSWESANFTRRIYGDEDLESIIKALRSQRILDGWSNMARNIEKIDFVRYALLYLYGGVYADADQELLDLEALQRVMEWNSPVLSVEQGGYWNASQQVGQAFMVSPPGHPFWWDLMEFLMNEYSATCNVLVNTGPLGVTNFWNSEGHKHIDVRLSRILDGRYDEAVFNKSATIHDMGGSWVDLDTHYTQLRDCKDRIPLNCFHCDERIVN